MVRIVLRSFDPTLQALLILSSRYYVKEGPPASTTEEVHESIRLSSDYHPYHPSSIIFIPSGDIRYQVYNPKEANIDGATFALFVVLSPNFIAIPFFSFP